jgi:hypothetical protein
LLAKAGISRDRSLSASARNLHKNTQILNMPDKSAANGPSIVGPWPKSSPFNFGARDCHGGS